MLCHPARVDLDPVGDDASTVPSSAAPQPLTPIQNDELTPFSRHPDQLTLELQPISPPAQPTRRFRSYERPTLLFLARHGAALSQQVVRRFATLDGKWPGQIVATIRSLVEDGFIQARRLNPAAGRSSREVLTLTPAGWAEVGRPSIPDPLAEQSELLGNRLQFVDFHIEMEVRAWVRLTDPRAQWTAIRTWGMSHYWRPGRTELDEECLRRISRMAPQTVPLQVWYHEEWKHVLFAAPSYRGHNMARLLAAMPTLNLFPKLVIYVVGAFPSRVDADRGIVERWAKSTGHQVNVRTIEPFADRTNPVRGGRPGSSQYVRYGAPSPRDSSAFDA